jgi:hypothetical protein
MDLNPNISFDVSNYCELIQKNYFWKNITAYLVTKTLSTTISLTAKGQRFMNTKQKESLFTN